MWAVKGNSRSVAHYFVSDEHPRIPLMRALCSRYISNCVRAEDLTPSGRKPCGECKQLLETGGVGHPLVPGH